MMKENWKLFTKPRFSEEYEQDDSAENPSCLGEGEEVFILMFIVVVTPACGNHGRWSCLIRASEGCREGVHPTGRHQRTGVM